MKRVWAPIEPEQVLWCLDLFFFIFFDLFSFYFLLFYLVAIRFYCIVFTAVVTCLETRAFADIIFSILV